MSVVPNLSSVKRAVSDGLVGTYSGDSGVGSSGVLSGFFSPGKVGEVTSALTWLMGEVLSVASAGLFSRVSFGLAMAIFVLAAAVKAARWVLVSPVGGP